MGGPQGPNDSTGQWARTPGQGDAADVADAAAPAQETPPAPLPNPYPADAYGSGGYHVPPQGYQYPQAPNPAWGQANPGAPAQGAQGGQWTGTDAWGRPAAPQWNPQQPNPQQPGTPQWNAYPGQPPAGQAPGQPWGPPPPGYPQQPQQPGTQPSYQWSPQAADASGGTGNSAKWIGIMLVAVAAVAAIGLFLSGGLGGKTLDQEAAQAGVTEILTDSYGLRAVGGVSCPSEQEVKEGASFDCTLTVDGDPKTVTVTFTDDDGTYEVGRPR